MYDRITLPRFTLHWLAVHEGIVRRYLDGRDPEGGESSSRYLGRFPTGCSDAVAQDILAGILRLRAAIEVCAGVSGDRAEAEGHLNEVVDATMELSSVWTEASTILVMHDLQPETKLAKHLKAIRRKASEKRKVRATADHKKWSQAAAEQWMKNSLLSVEKCAAQVKVGTGSTAAIKTIADVIRALKPPKRRLPTKK